MREDKKMRERERGTIQTERKGIIERKTVEKKVEGRKNRQNGGNERKARRREKQKRERRKDRKMGRR